MSVPAGTVPPGAALAAPNAPAPTAPAPSAPPATGHASAPLASTPLAPAAATAVPAAAVPRCDNCGASVPGRYCSACGQRLEAPVHSLWHFTQVAFEDITHADSRLWRTLGALLFRPGFLTHEFLAGRRARYLPPVRLYLVLSVVFFLWASMTQSGPQVVTISTSNNRLPTASVQPLDDNTVSILSPARPGETTEQRTARLCSKVTYDGPWKEQLAPAAKRACPKMVADNGRSLEEAYLHNLPRAMFLFLPLLAAAMMLMYWRPRHYYVEHLLLFVHNHAFVFLIVLLTWPLSALLPAGQSPVRIVVVLYIAWYAYRSMRVVYGQGRAVTLAKLVPLAFFYLLSGAIMAALTVVYSVLTL